MMVRAVANASVLAVLGGSGAFGAERFGSTIGASTVSGEGAVGKRVIARAGPIYRNERLRSNLTGLGPFELGDGTKLVLGRSASLILDRYVTQGGGKATVVLAEGGTKWLDYSGFWMSNGPVSGRCFRPTRGVEAG